MQGIYHKDLDGELRFVKKRVSLGMVGLVQSLLMVLLTRSAGLVRVSCVDPVVVNEFLA